MHQPRAKLLRLIGQHARRHSIDLARQSLLGFGFIDSGIIAALTMTSGRTGRTVWASPALLVPPPAQAVGTIKIKRDLLPQRREAPLQLPANRAAFAEQQNLHPFIPYVFVGAKRRIAEAKHSPKKIISYVPL